MANYSDAYGSFTFEGDWNEKDIQYFLELLSTQVYSEYCTYINDVPNCFYIAVKERRILFDGVGRWSYYNNLTYLHNWSNFTKDRWTDWNVECIPEPINYETYIQHRQDLLKSMYEKKLTIDVHYKDAEAGCDFINENTGILCVQYGVVQSSPEEIITSQYFLQYNEIFRNTTNYNLKNLCEIFYEDNETLYEFVYTFLDRVDLDRGYSDEVIQIITAHPTWFDLSGNVIDEICAQDDSILFCDHYVKLTEALQDAGISVSTQYVVSLLDNYLNPIEIISAYELVDLESAIEYARTHSTTGEVYGVFKEQRVPKEEQYTYELVWYDENQPILTFD